ncbi:RNA polymerase sigma factor [Allokutzneria sp. NRRL B-24872]|uniref:RNA polymerase sigma factor n=1 Tax=Allokutzneria sp. NRRL B-24872 TaxID=1137961 RepID=UPI000A383ED2|nr:sigma-70 family RNA polymerase sigma factor [Allokutzneria sp. NRRL B-24872]
MAEADQFRELYNACYPRVLAYASGHVGRQLGEDVVSETFAVAWRRRHEIPVPPLPWLLGVARNLLRTSRRTEIRQYELAAATARHEQFGEDTGGIVTERAAVLAALRTLPESEQELLTLVAWHGLTPKEAAKVLGCSTATFAVRLHRARRRLEKAVADTQDAAVGGRS